MSIVYVSAVVAGSGLAAMAALAGTVKATEILIINEAEAAYKAEFPDEWDLIESGAPSAEKTQAIREWNAFAHAYTSYRLAEISGSSEFSHFMGDAREEWSEMWGVTSSKERNKDETNNSYGREVYDSSLSRSQAVDAFIQGIYDNRAFPGTGDLIVDPNDPRQYAGDRALPDGNLLDDLKNLADDYGWAWNNPADVLAEFPPFALGELAGLLPNGLLPDWLLPGQGMYDKAPSLASPLVLDLDGDGIETTKMGYGANASSVYFDLDNDGFAERTGWVTGGDGLLAWDKNANGTIDNQSELFGNSATYTDGFAALDVLDTNSDNKITSADTDWSNLRIWVDADGDGITDSGELKTLATLSITEISLNSTPLTNTYNNENLVSDTSTFIIGGQTRTISDVWFRNDATDSRYLGDVELDEAVFYLPTLRGFGVLKDLHVAMSENANLLDLVSDFVTGWDTTKFGNKTALDAEIEEILFSWAGVENVSPTSRGAYVDAQELAFLEKYFDQPFSALGSGDPAIYQAAEIHSAFDYIFSHLKAQIISQSGLESVYSTDPQYNYLTGEIETGILSASAISDLSAEATSSGNATAYWEAVASTLISLKNPADFSASEISALNSAIQVNLPSSSWSAMVTAATMPVTHSYVATEFSDAITGVGPGNDYFYGLGGDDVYLFNTGFGIDYVGDTSGTDTIQFGAGITASDLRFERILYSEHLRVYVGGSANYITLERQFHDLHTGYNNYGEIETIRFSDNSMIDLWGGLTFKGTTGGETVDGTILADTMIGLSGNDYLYGYAGDDTYFFDTGFGTDYVGDSSGTDAIQFGAGITSSDLRFERLLSGDHLRVYVGGTGDYITLERQFYDLQNGTNTYGEMETIRFSDNSTINLWGGLTFKGTTSGDSIDGTNLADTIVGLSGNDYLYGYAGDDIYSFVNGDGLDYITDTDGVDTVRLGGTITTENITISDISTYNIKITSSAGVDEITIYNQRHPSNANRIEFLQFADGFKADLTAYNTWVWGTSSAQTTNGTSGVDTIFGRGGDDTINGLAGNDALHGGSGNDTVNGGDGNDLLYGGDGTDIIYGGNNDDTVDGGLGNDTLNGEAGTDTLKYVAATAGVTVSLAVTTAQSTGGSGSDTISNFENLTGSSFNDTLTGSTAANIILGGDGNDTIDGGAGNDTLNGENGTDTLKYTVAASAVTVSLALATAQVTGGAGTDTISNFENLTGSAYADILTGNSAANTILGANGNDTIDGGDGNDILNGEGGTDTLTYANASAGITISLSLATAQATGGSGTDTVSNFEKLTGSGYGDILTGNTAANTIYGGNGIDAIRGDGGNDLLYGEAGNDFLYGGAGTDTLTGGTGLDRFVFESTANGIDTIADFSLADDKIDISSILVGYDPLTDAITDFVQITTSGANSIFKVDADGGANAFVQIATITGVTGLTDEAALVTSGNLIVA